MALWYFAYGPSTFPERFTERYTVQETRPASLAGHRFVFAAADGAEHGTSALREDAEGTVLGAAYQVDEATLKQIGEAEPSKHFVTLKAQVEGREQDVQVLVADVEGELAAPSDDYLGSVRAGLTYFYPVTLVDAYLREAMQRFQLFASPMIQRRSEAVIKREYDLDFRRIYPWQGAVRTCGWGCATGVLQPGERTTPHHHDEEETAMILSGDGELTLGGQTTTVTKGDVVYHAPDTEHTYLNTGDGEMEILFLWWGGADVENHERARLGRGESVAEQYEQAHA